MLNNIKSQNDEFSIKNKNSMFSSTTLTNNYEFLDFADIFNAPEYDPSKHSLRLTRIADISSEETEIEDLIKPFDEENKLKLVESLKKHLDIEVKNSQEPEKPADIEDDKNFEAQIPNFCNYFFLTLI